MKLPTTNIRTTAWAGLIAVVAMASCGVPLDKEPSAIDRTTQVTDSVVATTSPNPNAQEVQVYFLRDDALIAVSYGIEGNRTLRKALTFLLEGARPDAPKGLISQIPAGTKLLGLEQANGTAQIDLSSEFDDLAGDVQKKAVAQLVYTTLALGGVERVEFRVDGTPIDAPTDKNNKRLVTADDFNPPLNPN